MTTEQEHRIRERAHQLWLDDGQPDGKALDHWFAAASEIEAAGQNENQGEGNVTAALDYNAQTQKFVKSGKVPAKAKEAKNAVDGPEGPDLRQAERAGKRRGRGEDPHGPGA